jgi:hypothetical protein
MNRDEYSKQKRERRLLENQRRHMETYAIRKSKTSGNLRGNESLLEWVDSRITLRLQSRKAGF